MIKKPMLAGLVDDVNKLKFPLWVTPKLDGIRALKVDGKLVSRTFKPIKNDFIRTMLEAILPDGVDGEIMSGSNFQETTKAVMTIGGEPSFQYFVFDYVKDSLFKPYANYDEFPMGDCRCRDLVQKVFGFREVKPDEVLQPVVGREVKSLEELLKMEARYIEQGYEGLMARTGESPYKCGRASMTNQWLVKLKRFEDSEAIILDCEERFKNENEAEKDAFGRTKRSSHQENKTATGTLGAFVVKDYHGRHDSQEFRVGTGLNQEESIRLWQVYKNNPQDIIGKIISYRYFPVGMKDLPRHPSYKGFRDLDDIS